MKILKLEEFLNEGYAELRKSVTDFLNLVNIDVTCKWDGEHWYYFERENKGTFDDFKALGKNKNTNFEIYFRYDFTLNRENVSTAEAECSVEELVRIHFSDMSNDEYDVEFVYCHGMDKFVDMIKTYDNSDSETINMLISEDLNDTEDDIMNDLEDRIGFKNAFDLTNDILNKAAEGFIDTFENKK